MPGFLANYSPSVQSEEPSYPEADSARPALRNHATSRFDTWAYRSRQSEDLRRFGGELNRFESVELSDIGTIALDDRVDTKFLFPVDEFGALLDSIRSQYRIVEVDCVRIQRYRTLYFDTEDFDLFALHHRNARRSFKVRSREYVDSDRSFLEVKSKVSPSRSIKTRIETVRLARGLAGTAGAFVRDNAPIEPERLVQSLWTKFHRVALLSRGGKERVTIDLGLQYRHEGSHAEVPRIAVAELKQTRMNRNSAFYQHMRSIGVRPGGFSKYCVGVAMLNPHLKHNRIKPKLRMIRGISNGVRCVR